MAVLPPYYCCHFFLLKKHFSKLDLQKNSMKYRERKEHILFFPLDKIYYFCGLRFEKSECGLNWYKIVLSPSVLDPQVFQSLQYLNSRKGKDTIVLWRYSLVFWLVMLEGAMCSLKSGPKYSK